MRSPIKILIAPNAFKNSTGAPDVARVIGDGLRQSRLNCRCECFPVGDGGDGTAELLVTHFGGRKVLTNVHDALGREILAGFGLIHEGRTAVIELAEGSGLRRLGSEELEPWRANTFGTGELIKAALDHGARDIVIGAGGSATIDGAIGILRALGVRFLGSTREPLVNLPQELGNLAILELSELDRRLTDCTITVMCDVSNPLLGEHGAATVFGPQKGATPTDVELLEKGLTRLAEVLQQQTGRDVGKVAHGGAAGGTAAGLLAVLNAKLVAGIEYFLDMTEFDAALDGVDVVISGEGRIDEQTLQGKAPYGVASRAKAKGIPVIALAGEVPLAASESLRHYFDVILPIGQRPITVAEALKHCAHNLQRTALELGNIMAVCMNKQTPEYL